MKTLLLDVDGVLDLGRDDTKFGEWPPHSSAGEEVLEELQLKNLKRIVDETGCSLVLSSDWRNFDHLRLKLAGMLEKFDIPLPISSTPNLAKEDAWEDLFATRVEEITAWLLKHPEVTNFAVVDDMDLEGLGDHFFQTKCTFGLRLEDDTSEEGLTDEIADAIIAFLNKD